jgi:cytochrome c oxidase subunit IV
MSEHVSSLKLYIGIWITLLVCTLLTVLVAEVNLPGPLNAVVALAIATFKATLVALFFMHVKYAHEKMTKVVIVSALFWLAILMALSMADYATRLWT